jgi:uncharacterized protein (TIGR02270 family)
MPTYITGGRIRFPELAAFDETIDAHLDGLIEAGKMGFDAVEAELGSESPDAAGDTFAALALALLAENPDRFLRVVQKAHTAQDYPTALNGALGWIDTPIVRTLIEGQQTHLNPLFADAALAHCHTHGFTGGDSLRLALAANDPKTIARAFKTAGECGRLDLLPIIKTWLAERRNADLTSNYYAAWASILLGQSAPAVGPLTAIGTQPNPFRIEAVNLLCVALSAKPLRNFLKLLRESPESLSLAIKAAGWSGNAEYVPWLIEQMGDGVLAQLAGESFRLITGFDYDAAGATVASATAPSDDKSVDAALQISEYPVPNQEYVSDWWQKHQKDFADAPRLLLGKPVTLDWLDTILAEGEQAHRELAALHRVILQPGSTLLPTRANAAIQWHRLLQLRENHS